MKKISWESVKCAFWSLWLIAMLFLPYGHIANEAIGNAWVISKNAFAPRHFCVIWGLMVLITLINVFSPIFNQWKDGENQERYISRSKKWFVWTMFFMILIFALMCQVNTVYYVSMSILYLIVFFSAPVFLLLCIKFDPVLFKKLPVKEKQKIDEIQFSKTGFKALKILFILLLIILLPIYVVSYYPIFPNSYIYFSGDYATVYGSYFGVSYSDKLINQDDVYNGGMAIGLDGLIRLQFGEFSFDAYGFNDFNMYGTTSLELDKNHTYTYYSDNYEYMKALIEELKKERDELLYGSGENYDDLEDLKEGFEKLEELSNRIENLQNILNTMNYQYMKVTYHVQEMRYMDVKILDEVIYDTQRNNSKEDTVKWGVKKNWLYYPIAKENIILSEDEFEKGTDFNKTKIGVKIFYNDGSMKLTYITPNNANELNNAEEGNYKIYWTDSWGSYEKEIKII